jgi:serine/threonine protein kinase
VGSNRTKRLEEQQLLRKRNGKYVIVFIFFPWLNFQYLHFFFIENNFFHKNLLEILLPLLNGLAQAESEGICHRDIKPQNIIYNPKSGKYKLTNFSIAAICPKGQKTFSINVDEISGTPFFMSPELYMAFSEKWGRTEKKSISYDPFKSDVWSLGVTILVMMRIPNKKLSKLCKGKTAVIVDILENHVKKDYPNFYDIISGMLKFYPEQRLSFSLVECLITKNFPENILAL